MDTSDIQSIEALLRSIPEATTRAHTLSTAARKLARSGDVKRALAVSSEALVVAARSDDASCTADATEALADAHFAASSFPQAMGHYLDALSRWQKLDDRSGQARCLQGIASIDISVGDYAFALSRLEEAMALADAEGDLSAHAAIHHRLGMVYSRLGELSRSEEFHARALAAQRGLGDEASVASSLNSLGVLLLRVGEQRQKETFGAGRGEFTRACRHFEEAAEIATRAGDLHLQALALGNIGSAMAFLGEIKSALPLFHQQLQALRAMQARHDEALCLTNIGEALRLSGQYRDAVDALEQALAIGTALQTKSRMMRAHLELSRSKEALGDAVTALQHYKQYHRLEQALRSDDAEARARSLTVQMSVAEVRAEAEGYKVERDRLAAANVRLEMEAHQDVLTGLANRRFLDAKLAGLLTRMNAAGDPFCIALVDIDHFKAINDRFSHALGDEVLREVGALLRTACRPSDLAVRYGGEEFVLALLYTSLPTARQVCERLRSTIESFPWSRIAPGLAVTISVGLSDAEGQATPDAMLGTADQRLYAAKHAGRNRVC